MRAVLADTHAVIWYLNDPSELSSPAREALAGAATDRMLHIASVSVVEIVYLVDKRRIRAELLDALFTGDDAGRVVPVPLDFAIARRVAEVPRDIVGRHAGPHHCGHRACAGADAGDARRGYPAPGDRDRLVAGRGATRQRDGDTLGAGREKRCRPPHLSRRSSWMPYER